MSRVELKYRTFNEVLDEVSLDFKKYDAEGLIDVASLIKVCQKINKELGLKLNREEQTIVDVIGSRAKLPLNFYRLESARICYDAHIIEEIPTGIHTEEIFCSKCKSNTCKCDCTLDYYVGGEMRLIHRTKYITYDYRQFSNLLSISDTVYNVHCNKDVQLRDGYLYIPGVENATLYITYLSTMEDEAGNLLVLDNPIVNEYYEYALKQRILENLYLDEGEDVAQKLGYVTQRLREARNNALSLVNTPDFKTLLKCYTANRKRMYNKYYKPFDI